MSEIIALAGWSPEVLAYAYAKYSRSALSIRQSIKDISDDKAGKFLDTNYFNYGHRSIADNAHVSLACEGISELAAYELEDQSLWDGQEKSTRYQDFTGADAFFVPSSLAGSQTLNESYVVVASFLMKQYVRYSAKCFDWLIKNNPKPQDKSQEAYERAMKARAFDVARYWLFNGIRTSVGQITNARTLEDQISRLMSSEYQELRDLGESMKQACSSKPFCPDGRDEPPVAPTLVKYTAPNAYLISLRKKMHSKVEKFMFSFGPSRKRFVDLSDTESFSICDLDVEIVASLLYEVSNYSYFDILEQVWLSSENQRREIIDIALEDRDKHDPLPRAFAAGHAIQFDISIDRGAQRDLHRHRNCIQISQPLSTERGWDVPAMIGEVGMEDDFNEGMLWVKKRIDDLRVHIGVDSDYLIPFAFRSGVLYKMNLAQAVYMSELRSGTGGHFSYRDVANQMHNRLSDHLPFLEDHARVTPFENQDLLKR